MIIQIGSMFVKETPIAIDNVFTAGVRLDNFLEIGKYKRRERHGE